MVASKRTIEEVAAQIAAWANEYHIPRKALGLLVKQLRHVRGNRSFEDTVAGISASFEAAAGESIEPVNRDTEATDASGHRSTTLQGELEIGHEAGTLWFHSSNPSTIEALGTQTPLRIQGLPAPIPRGTALDVRIKEAFASWQERD